MNKQESDILNTLLLEPFINQRILSEVSGHSLGVVNRSLKNLIKEGYVDEHIRPTEKAKLKIKTNSPKNAIILAAGFGMRMVPINTQTPKALMEVNGETLIERTIEQLHEVGVKNIYVVVGYMKEQFEYLIDEYGVELIVNEEYAEKNNLHSLHLASSHLSNTYIIPCDIWCDRNPFHRHELYSWYMVSDLVDNESTVRVNRKMELVTSAECGNQMVGIAYLVEEQSKIVRERLENLDCDKSYDGSFWEETLVEKDRMIVQARVVHASDVVGINTYEQLRELDEESNHLKSDAISIIADVLKVSDKEVIDIIHKAGGKAFLAHPFEYKFNDTIGFIDNLRKEVELDGIECFHPSSENDNKIDILVNYTRKNNLFISGGSDYHGNPKPDIEIGIGRGKLNIPKEIIEEWK